MVAEYSVTLENKTKSELILFIKQLQDMLKEKDRKLEKKDKQIDLMANYIVDLIKYNNPEEKREVEEIKQYFESKVEEC